MNTQSCSAAPPPFSRCSLPTPQHNYLHLYFLPPHSLGRPLRRGHPLHEPPPPPPDDLNSCFIGKMEAVRQEHPGLPTTPPNSSQFLYLFSACLHMAREEVSLLLPFPLISWILWPLVFPILPFLLQFSHFFLSTQIVSNKIHTYSIISTVCRAFPLPYGVLLPCSLSEQPFPQSCLYFLPSPSLLCPLHLGFSFLHSTETVFDEVTNDLQWSLLCPYLISQQQLTTPFLNDFLHLASG